jgi:hypothetical protein
VPPNAEYVVGSCCSPEIFWTSLHVQSGTHVVVNSAESDPRAPTASDRISKTIFEGNDSFCRCDENVNDGVFVVVIWGDLVALVTRIYQVKEGTDTLVLRNNARKKVNNIQSQ